MLKKLRLWWGFLHERGSSLPYDIFSLDLNIQIL